MGQIGRESFRTDFSGGGGGGGLSGYTEDQLIFGAADGTGEQSANLLWNDTALRINDGQSNIFMGPEAVPGPAGIGATSNYNVGIGYGSLNSLTDGADNNIAIGLNSLRANTDGDSNIGIGPSTLRNLDGAYGNIALGSGTGYGVTLGNKNILLGYYTAQGVTTGGYNVFIGGNVAASIQTGGYNVVIGDRAFGSTSNGASYNIVMGLFAGNDIGSNYNIAIGVNSMNSATNTSGPYNIGIGTNTLTALTSGTLNVVMGTGAGTGIDTGDGNVCIGPYVGTALSGNADGNVLIGNSIPGLASRDNNVGIGREVFGNSSGTSASDNVAIGYRAMYNISGSASQNVCIGYVSGTDITTGDDNVCIGPYSGGNITTANDNIAIGDFAGFSIQTGGSNVVIGVSALSSGEAGVSQNICIGTDAGDDLGSDNNIAIGRNALATPVNTTDSGNQIAIGRNSLNSITTGSTNVALGYNAGGDITTGANNIMIGQVRGVAGSNALLWIDSYNTASPLIEGDCANDILQINGQLESHNHYPITDDTYYLGKNDDDSPLAWKGVILKDQTTGTYYRLQIDSGAVTLVDLTD